MNKPSNFQSFEIPNHVEIVSGQGGLPLAKIRTPWSVADIYLLGAHVTHFQKNGEPPLLFMSAKSCFAEGKAIRGGVPVCFPWFGPRDGDLAHGFVRFSSWELVKTSAAGNGGVTLHFALPALPGREQWKSLRMEFVVTVAETLTMDLVATNESCGETLVIENCLHTYFQVGDISAISIIGLQGAPFNDFAAGAGGAAKSENDSVLTIAKETNRVYPANAATVEIRDPQLKRTIRVEKTGSQSTVVWNPWTTQKMPDDFDQAEHRQMVCVESGNVKQDKLSLAPGKTAALQVVLSSVALV
jgi:glucose-6-phosphate 1-epimerase